MTKKHCFHTNMQSDSGCLRVAFLFYSGVHRLNECCGVVRHVFARPQEGVVGVFLVEASVLRGSDGEVEEGDKGRPEWDGVSLEIRSNEKDNRNNHKEKETQPHRRQSALSLASWLG